jgi:hypothetical protein
MRERTPISVILFPLSMSEPSGYLVNCGAAAKADTAENILARRVNMTFMIIFIASVWIRA